MSSIVELDRFIPVVDRPDEYNKVEMRMWLRLRIQAMKTRHPFVDTLGIS
jgi:hypothetical protein